MYLLTIEPTQPQADKYQVAFTFVPTWDIARRFLDAEIDVAIEAQAGGVYDVATPDRQAALHILEALVGLDTPVRIGRTPIRTLANKQATVTLALITLIRDH